MKVLIIDDEKGVTDIYKETFSKKGHEVATANQGQDGIDQARQFLPDLILLDIIMPQMNGLDVLKLLKADESTRNTPVVLLTNLPSEMSEEKATALGAIKYLVKADYDPSEVIKIIEEEVLTKK